MDILVYVILPLALVVTIVGATLASRSRFVQLRRINAYNAMPLTVGEAVESEKTVHVSFGSSAIRDTSTIAAVWASGTFFFFAGTGPPRRKRNPVPPSHSGKIGFWSRCSVSPFQNP